MSGVCGMVSFSGAPVDPGVLRAMTEASPHRGPDGVTFWSDELAGLAHQALHSTPEAVREAQPLVCTRSGVCLTADARIDNRRELIPELRSSGHLELSDPTDADLILAAHGRWGSEFPLRLIGDFAIVLWDPGARRLLLVRDALGIKPLHYGVLPEGLAFASEAQQVLAYPGISNRLDRRSLTEFLAGIRRETGRTAFAAIRRLLPGHLLVADSRGIRTLRYWDPSGRPMIRYRNSDDYAEHYLSLLKRAVRDRLRTQCPTIGIYMSGGLDSTSVAAVAKAELQRVSDAPLLVALSYVFDEFRSCDEREHSSQVAEHCDFEIVRIPADRRPILDVAPPPEGPELSWEAADRAARESLADRGGRVVLTGHLRDFGLFGQDRIANVHRLFRGQWGLLVELGEYARRNGLSLARVVGNQLLKPLLPDRLLRIFKKLRGHAPPPRVPEWLSPEAAALAEIRKLLTPVSGFARLLRKGAPEVRRRLLFLDDLGSVVYWHDRAAARCGVEARHPLLDRRLAEYLCRIPPEEVCRPGFSKPLARRAMTGLLPEAIRLRQDKTTFEEYIVRSIRSHSGDLVRELLTDPLLGRMGLVDAEKLRRAWSSCAADPSGISALWFPLAAELWLRENCRRSAWI